MSTSKWAGIKKSEFFMYINAFTGRFGAWGDHDAFGEFLELDAKDRCFGVAIRQALLASRYVTDDDKLIQFYKHDQPKRHSQWVKETMFTYGFTDENKFHDSYVDPFIELIDGVITFMPSMKESAKKSKDDGVPESDYIKIPFDASDEELGAAARLALSRCK